MVFLLSQGYAACCAGLPHPTGPTNPQGGSCYQGCAQVSIRWSSSKPLVPVVSSTKRMYQQTGSNVILSCQICSCLSCVSNAHLLCKAAGLGTAEFICNPVGQGQGCVSAGYQVVIKSCISTYLWPCYSRPCLEAYANPGDACMQGQGRGRARPGQLAHPPRLWRRWRSASRRWPTSWA